MPKDGDDFGLDVWAPPNEVGKQTGIDPRSLARWSRSYPRMIDRISDPTSPRHYLYNLTQIRRLLELGNKLTYFLRHRNRVRERREGPPQG